MEYGQALLHTDDTKWVELDESAKVEALQAIENQMAKEENRRPCPVEPKFLQTGCDGIVLGTYGRENDTIYVNSSQFDGEAMYGKTSDHLVKAVIHEGRHAYQCRVAEGLIEQADKESATLWRTNLAEGNYVSYRQNPKAYYEQPVEVDARSFATKRYETLVEERVGATERADARVAFEAQMGPRNSGDQILDEQERVAFAEGVSR